MNITNKPTGDYTASLTVDVTPEDFMPKVHENLEKIRKKANIPGFRPGKAPMGLVKRQYGKSSILEEVNQMAFESVYKHIEDNKIRVIGRPLINIEETPKIDDITEEQSYTFVFDIGIVPEFDVNLSSEISVEYRKVGVTDEALDKEIEALRKRHASFDKSDTVTEDCMVTGHLSADDPAVEKTPEEEEKARMYRYFYIDKLDENPKIKKRFLGAKTAEQIEIPAADLENREAIQFLLPESIDIQNKQLKITFTPAEMYTSKPAEMNTDFFEKNFPGRNISNEQEFRATLKEELERHFIRQCDDIFLNSAKKKLLELINLPLPADFVKRFLLETNQDEEEQKLKDIEEKFDDYLDYIKWEFIQDKLFETHQITIGAEDFRNYIRDFYREYLNQEEVSDEKINTELKQLVEDKKRMDGIEESIRRKKTLELFMQHLSVKEVIFASFEEMAEKESKPAKAAKSSGAKTPKKKAVKKEQ